MDDVKSFTKKLVQNNVSAELVVEEANFHNYFTFKECSRNGARENSISELGKFLYGKGRKVV